ncbi:P-loop containing nucleoside triphosphate hydrolase protein [Peziza echinospora]|nr:P-loop containing nucleoside triphosphate hydrolase protein [Peziza echinospora]
MQKSLLQKITESQASAASLRLKEGSPGVAPPSPTRASANEGFPSTGGGNVRVVVRVRGVNPREAERGASCLVEIDPHTQATILHPPSEADRQSTRKNLEKKVFTFDNSFWSANPEDHHYADQDTIYNCLGEEFLDHNFEGYHTCIFAYGQTGSGKSYSMMGVDGNPGLIPRTCEDLFERIECNKSPDASFSVRVSYFEVYNEQVRDLLAPRTDPPRYLKIRESPTEGPHVKDLIDVPVRNFTEVMRYMKMGDQNRTVASTKMNDTSSRSHAVFTLMLRSVHHDVNTDETTERTARIRLVDLAGSERANATGATGVRLREGGNINKSLTTLGRVIAALAGVNGTTPGSGRQKKEVVPYRDSVLTWLLKDSLGGNSKTAMIACISPTDYDETLSTLRYADQAKHIKTRATINEDQVSVAIRDAKIEEMAETIRALQISMGKIADTKKQNEFQSAQLEEYQNQVNQMQRLMEETKQIAEVKIKSLQTQNEALRLHLKLAVESLRNPIPSAPVQASNSASDQLRQRRENMQDMVDEGLESDYDSDEERNNMTTEVEIKVDELVKDLALFKRRCGDDKTRMMLNSLQDTRTVRIV